MIERTIEQTLVRHVKQAGGIAPKFTSPGTAGMPDRIIILPGGKIGFVELKRPGQKPRPIQQRQIDRLTQLGAPVYILDSPNTETIKKILDAIQTA